MIEVAEQTTFPAFGSDIQTLVESHKEIEDERLLLAIYYAPQSDGRDPQHVFLFEVYDGWRRNEVSPERDLEEVVFGSTEAFPLGRKQLLHIVVTNPPELEIALEEGWPLACEIREAIAARQFKVVYLEEDHRELLERIIA